MDIFMVIFFIFEAAMGVASTLYLVVSLFVVLGFKIYSLKPQLCLRQPNITQSTFQFQGKN